MLAENHKGGSLTRLLLNCLGLGEKVPMNPRATAKTACLHKDPFQVYLYQPPQRTLVEERFPSCNMTISYLRTEHHDVSFVHRFQERVDINLSADTPVSRLGTRESWLANDLLQPLRTSRSRNRSNRLCLADPRAADSLARAAGPTSPICKVDHKMCTLETFQGFPHSAAVGPRLFLSRSAKNATSIHPIVIVQRSVSSLAVLRGWSSCSGCPQSL